MVKSGGGEAVPGVSPPISCNEGQTRTGEQPRMRYTHHKEWKTGAGEEVR